MKETLEQYGGGPLGETETQYLFSLETELAHARKTLRMFQTGSFPEEQAWYLEIEGPEKYEIMADLCEAVLEIIQACSATGVSISVIGLTHTKIQYPGVILEMRQLIRDGKLDDALALYKQPRKYNR